MQLEETDIGDTARSLNEVNSLDDDFARMHFKSASSDKQATYDEVDSQLWNTIETESNAEFLENHGITDKVTPTSKDNTINPIDCYRHFITDEVISLMVRETN